MWITSNTYLFNLRRWVRLELANELFGLFSETFWINRPRKLLKNNFYFEKFDFKIFRKHRQPIQSVSLECRRSHTRLDWNRITFGRWTACSDESVCDTSSSIDIEKKLWKYTTFDFLSLIAKCQLNRPQGSRLWILTPMMSGRFAKSLLVVLFFNKIR